MTRLSQLTLRNYLIALHDALATAFALLAAFYLRFEGGESFFDRLPLLLRILPYFRRLQRRGLLPLQPDHDEMALHLAAGCAEHPARGHGADATRCWCSTTSLSRRTCTAPFFFGKITIVLYWFLEVSSLSALRFAYRYFRYTRVRHHARAEDASPTLLIGRAADAEVLLRGIESGAVKRIWPVGVLSPSLADRGQSIRNVPVLGGIDDVEDVVRDFAGATSRLRASS